MRSFLIAVAGLMLFANGVAAKTDLKGDNLAGQHQAEGFATMDVANPAAIADQISFCSTIDAP